MEETTKELAQFLSRVQFDDLPPEVVEQAKRCLLDFTGVTIAAAEETASQKIFDFFRKLGGFEESSVVKYAYRTSCPLAALINGSMAHELELDDGHIVAHAHPGVTSIPAALAVAEKLRSTGKDLLTAIVVAYEAVIRIGEAICPSTIYGRGIHAPALVGTFGGASAVGKLLRLNEAGMVHALGNCCLTPVAPFQTFKEGAMIKDLYGGWPAFVGTIAGLMAGEGFSGPTKILEGPLGFCKNVSDDFDLKKITENLGQEWMIMGIYFKKHASCSLSHTTMDATLALMESHPIIPDEIEKVVVKTHRFASDLNEKAPKTSSAAKSSIPFCVSLAIHNRRVSLEGFSEENIRDEKILTLAEKVDLRLDPELDKIHLAHENLRPSIVKVYLRDGRVFAERREVAKGWAVNPMTDGELEEKFRGLAEAPLSKKRATCILELIKGTENLPDVMPIVKEFSKF